VEIKKALLFVFLFYSWIIHGQVPYQQIRLEKYNQEANKIIKIDGCGISSNASNDLIYQYLNFYPDKNSNTDKSTVDTMDFIPYSIELRVFESLVYPDYVIMWITENEYNSEIHLFYFIDKKISKIGAIPIQSCCDACDSKIYPIEKILIIGNENSIEFKFSEPFEYNTGHDIWQKYNPEQIRLIFDKKNRKLTWHQH